MTPQQLKNLRKKLSLTQKQLAEQLKVHITTVQRYEQGDVDIPYAVELALQHLRQNKSAEKD